MDCVTILPLGVLWAQSLQIVDGIRNQLNHMHAYLCRDDTDQLILPQGEIDITVVGQNVAKQRHPYLCKSGQVGAHDLRSFLCSGTGEILPWYA